MSTRSPGRWRDVGGAVWWRQVRSDVWADLAIGTVVAITAFVVVAAPRVLDHASSRDLSAAFTTATPEERNLRFQAFTEIGAGPPGDPFRNVDLRGRQLRDEHIPRSVVEVLGGEQWVVDSPEFVVTSFPDEAEGTFSRTFRFRYQQGIDEHIRLVAGTAPAAHDPIVALGGSDCPVDVAPEDFEPVDGLDCAVASIPVLEAAVTRQTADDMMVEVGDVVSLRPSVADRSFRTSRVDARELRFALRISGIVELDDDRLDFWYADTSLHRPRITETADFRLVIAVGLISPDQYRVFTGAAPGVTLAFSWRYLIDPVLVERADAVQLRDDVAKISTPDVEVVTLLPELLGAHLAQRRLAAVLLAVSALGVVGAALASIWVLATIDGVRRKPVSELLAGRGASRAQLAVHAARTAALVTVPAAMLGSISAWAVFADTGPQGAFVPAILATSAAFGSVVLAGMPPRRSDRGSGRPGRLVAEILVVFAAIGAMVLVVRRDSAVTDAVGRGFDVTLALAPALVALAVGVVALRAIGPLALVISRFAERHRSAAWFVGARRLVSQPSALRTPIVAIVMAASAAVFATVVTTSLDHNRELASWQALGGDVRVETGVRGSPLPERLQAHLSEGPETPAFGATLPFQRFEGPSGGFVSDVVALDTAAFIGIVGERILADLVDVPIDPLRDGGEPLPAILVGGRSGGSNPVAGDIAELRAGGSMVPFELIDATRHFPGLPTGRPTILVDRAALAAATDARTVAPTFALLDDDDLVNAELRAIVDDPRVLVGWTTRADRLASLNADPLSVWTVRSAWLLSLAAVGLAVVAAAGGALITATTRRRDLGVLAILGLERRAAARLVAIELLPGVVVAVAAGAVGGAATARVLGGNLGLEVFAGVGGAANVVFAWPTIAGLVGLLVASIGIAVGATVRSLRDVDHAMLLRKGDV